MNLIDINKGLTVEEVTNYFNEKVKKEYLDFKIFYKVEPDRVVINTDFYIKYINNLTDFITKDKRISYNINISDLFGVGMIFLTNDNVDKKLIRYERIQVIGKEDSK